MRILVPSALLLAAVAAAAPVPKVEPVRYKHLDDDTIQAFKTLGFEYGGLVQVPNGRHWASKGRAATDAGALPLFVGGAGGSGWPAVATPYGLALDRKPQERLEGLRAKNLKALILNGHWEDADMAVVRQLRELTLLDVTGLGLTDAGFAGLDTALPDLVSLEVRYAKLTDDGAKPIGRLKRLRALKFYSSTLTDAGCKHLSGLESLSCLVLQSGGVGDAATETLARMPALAHVGLACTRTTDAGYKHLATLQRLESLDLTVTQVGDAGVQALAGVKTLTRLELGRTAVTDAAAAALKGHPRLTYLDLNSTAVTDRALKDLHGNVALTVLHLGGAKKVTDAGLDGIAALVNLSELGLNGTGVTDAGLADIAKLKSLTRLELVGTNVTAAGLMQLAGGPQLTRIDLPAGFAERDLRPFRALFPKCLVRKY